MTQLLPTALVTRISQGDTLAIREILEMQASGAINRQAWEQFWIGTVIAVGAVFALVAGAGILIDLDPLFKSADVIAISQLITLSILILTAAIYLFGRLRMVRSELDLLRLKLEWLDTDETAAQENAVETEENAQSLPIRDTSISRYDHPDLLA